MCIRVVEINYRDHITFQDADGRVYNPLGIDAQWAALLVRHKLAIHYSAKVGTWQVYNVHGSVLTFHQSLARAICECVANAATPKGYT